MILALTYEKNQNNIGQHFGESKNFLLVNMETLDKKVIDNGGFSHKSLIPYLLSLNVNTLICGGIGTTAVELLNEAGISVIPGISGDADMVINEFTNGVLKGDRSYIHECDCN